MNNRHRDNKVGQIGKVMPNVTKSIEAFSGNGSAYNFNQPSFYSSQNPPPQGSNNYEKI